MRGFDSNTEALFTYVTPESFVPKDHPLRAIRKMADEALAGMDSLFDSMYAATGRSSIPPEKLLKAQLLMILYSIRSNRQLVEQIHYNFLFRWFLGMALDEKVWDHSSFTKNSDRLIGSEVAATLLSRILAQAERKRLLSREHFTVDGTLIEAWASIKSFKPKDGPPSAGGGRNSTVDFKGQKLANDTHGSTTDPDAKLYRKGKNKESKLCYQGHTLMENRSGLIVRTAVTSASGTGERDAAMTMVRKLPRTTQRITLGGDKGYDTGPFVKELRGLRITPHVAQNDTNRDSAIDGRTTRHPNYAVSQKLRKRIEEGFGWMKTIGGMRKTMYRGIEKIAWQLDLHAAAYNLLRMKNLGLGVT
ncbi:MAG: IS5 family transposase [Deltaproteobacteria bacterium]|nr:IS5 family transposase [Deltaproteobacteria bacterium]